MTLETAKQEALGLQCLQSCLYEVLPNRWLRLRLGFLQYSLCTFKQRQTAIALRALEEERHWDVLCARHTLVFLHIPTCFDPVMTNHVHRLPNLAQFAALISPRP